MAKRRNQNNKQHQQQSSQVSHQPAAQSRPQSSAPQTSSHSSGSGKQSVQTISQERAKHALAQVKDWSGENAKDQKELKSYASNFPAMVLMSGFGQACAFYRSKGGNHELLFKAVASWLHTQKIYASSELMDEIVGCDAAKYQLAQAEALEYLGWVKKFAKAYLQEG